MAYYFEDFAVGGVFELGQCTVSEEEIVAFGIRYDPQLFHADRVGGRLHVRRTDRERGAHDGSVHEAIRRRAAERQRKSGVSGHKTSCDGRRPYGPGTPSGRGTA